MGAVTYPDPTVAGLINENFVPVQLNIADAKDIVQQYNVIWTPNINIVDHRENVSYHWEGWLSPSEFAPMLIAAKGHFEWRHKRFEEGAQFLEKVCETYPGSYFAPEALYYLGVCRYMASHDAEQLVKFWKRLQQEYPDSTWARSSKVL
jgi:hypothetical protein